MQIESNLKSIAAVYPDRKCKLYLVHGFMSHDEVHSLYAHPKIKALISLSHGEGYGLPVFESAYVGKPVVTTDWSGQKDFLYAPKKVKGKIKNRPHFAKVDYDIKPIQKEAVWDTILVKESMWAYPKERSAKEKMREVYKDFGRFESQAKKLKKHLDENFSEEKIYDNFYQHLKEFIEYEDEIDSMFNEISL